MAAAEDTKGRSAGSCLNTNGGGYFATLAQTRCGHRLWIVELGRGPDPTCFGVGQRSDSLQEGLQLEGGDSGTLGGFGDRRIPLRQRLSSTPWPDPERRPDTLSLRRIGACAAPRAPPGEVFNFLHFVLRGEPRNGRYTSCRTISPLKICWGSIKLDSCVFECREHVVFPAIEVCSKMGLHTGRCK